MILWALCLVVVAWVAWAWERLTRRVQQANASLVFWRDKTEIAYLLAKTERRVRRQKKGRHHG